MKPLKDIYTTPSIFYQLSNDLKGVYPRLNQEAFYQALVKDLDQLELKARIERVADVCREFLPESYEQSLKILYRFCAGKENKFVYLFLPAYVARFGCDHFSLSLKALRDFTQYSSSEEGIRAYLSKDTARTLRVMIEWTTSSNVHIRRLASEGCRPRLPWAKKIPVLIENPELTWPILEMLKTDSQKYVQKSVANHINDISKDHPDWLLDKIKLWDLKQPATAWIVRHGMRTLVKQGNKKALALFGYQQKPLVIISREQWTKKCSLNETFGFSIDLKSTGKKIQTWLIDYRLYFCKKNGKLTQKIFKLKTINIKPDEIISVKAKYEFRDLSTRQHYVGQHGWQLLINGEPLELRYFDVE